MEQTIPSFSYDLFFKWQIGCQQPDSSCSQTKRIGDLVNELIL
jgi:hypothetical protein